MMIKAICFDLDGVYFTKESFSNFVKALSINTSIEKAEFVLKKSPKMFDFKKGLICENEFWDFVRTELSITYSNDEIFDILKDSYSVDQEVANIVIKARERGYKTCICSNNFETRIRELNAKFDFLKDFDAKVFSYQVGIMKPDIKIFEELINSAKVEPSEMVYSDDSIDKLEGATKLGINTFVYENFEQFIQNLNSLGVDLQ